MGPGCLFRSIVIFLIASMLLLFSCSRLNIFDSDAKLIEEAGSLTWLTENFPPYNYGQTGSLNGVAVEVLETMFDQMEVNLSQADISLTDWTNAYKAVQDNEGTVLFSMVRSPDRENMFKWVGPIAPHKEVIIAPAGTGIKIVTDADLTHYHFGVVNGYSSYNLLRDRGVDPGKIIEYPGSTELYQAMIDGEVQCISYSEQANLLIPVGLGYLPEDFLPVYTINVDQLYYAFNQSVSNSLINLFQEKLDLIKNDKEADGSSTHEKILQKYSVILSGNDSITNDMVTSLVDHTVADFALDASGTITKMNEQQAPYRDSENTALYCFAYDTDLTIVAHAANVNIIGLNFKGKPDVTGKLFRDEILAGALEEGSGWVDYIYTKPDQSGLYLKTTYFTLTTGSDGKQYIVCAGRYK
ncbi:MAG: transporter substrate-binding domain-containing protein [Bacteroidetes bacterium]|nr:transporter substrate-binding domain-containing protein [Bacteroidota bacterium]